VVAKHPVLACSSRVLIPWRLPHPPLPRTRRHRSTSQPATLRETGRRPGVPDDAAEKSCSCTTSAATRGWAAAVHLLDEGQHASTARPTPRKRPGSSTTCTHQLPVTSPRRELDGLMYRRPRHLRRGPRLLTSRSRHRQNNLARGRRLWPLTLGPTVKSTATRVGGRTDEAFGEDPYLVGDGGRTSTATRADAEREVDHVLKVAATAKHFAAEHTEDTRNAARPTPHRRETAGYYLKQFQSLIEDSGVSGLNESSTTRSTARPRRPTPYTTTPIARGRTGMDGT